MEQNTMTLTIDHPEADELARELSQATGESLTQAVVTALRERLEREKEKAGPTVSLKEELLRIGRECAALPLLDWRSPDEFRGWLLREGSG
jgi:antitoxin VapB